MSSIVTIAIITADLVGGIRRHVHSIVLGLDPMRFRVLYFFSESDHDQKAEADLAEMATKPHIVLIPLKRVAKAPKLADLTNVLRIASVCHRFDCRLFHGHGAKAGMYARIVKLFVSGKSLYSPHGGSGHSQFSWARNFVYTSLERMVRDLTNLYVFESEYTQAAFLKKFHIPSKNYRVVYNGVEDRRPSKSSPTGPRPIVAVIGVLRSEKGQDIAMESARILSCADCDISMIFAGDGPWRSRLERQANEFDLAKSVTLLGDIPDVSSLIDASTMVLIPSRFESFGYVAVEALLHDRPVVAASVGGLRETVMHGKTGILVTNPSPENFAEAIQAVLAGEYRFDFQSEEVERHRNRFRERDMVGSLADIYEALVSADRAVSDRQRQGALQP